MRKRLFVVAALACAALWLSGPALAGCKCGCPCQILGAEKAVTNTADGVSITITAKDPAVAGRLEFLRAHRGQAAEAHGLAHVVGRRGEDQKGDEPCGYAHRPQVSKWTQTRHGPKVLSGKSYFLSSFFSAFFSSGFPP